MLAASNIPIKVTAIAKPPLIPENKTDKLSRRFSAIFDFSSVIPIKTKSGIARRVGLVIIPYIRFGRPVKKDASNSPRKIPITANINDVPARANETGTPKSRIAMIEMNNNKESHSIIMTLIF